MPAIRLPVPEGNLSTQPIEKQVQALTDLVMRFRRELEYLLNGNLDEDNGVIKAEVAYIEQIFAEYITTNVIEASTLITNVFTANKGYVSELTVDILDSSDKVRNYKNGDKSPVGYIKIYDQHLDFIDAQYVGDIGGVAQREQTRDRKGELVYWLDATMSGITMDVTEWPVWQYKYNELVKLQIFHEFDSTTGYYNPKIVLGAGSGVGNNAKGFMYKGATGLYIDYLHSVTGALRRIMLTDDGVDFSEIADGKVIYADQTVVNGIVQVFVDTAFPTAAKTKDILADTDDYSRYDRRPVTSNASIDVTQEEFVEVTGTTPITLTLSSTSATTGCIKKIKNSSTAIVTLSGTIDGGATNILYPKEALDLIWNGADWRAV